MQLPSLERVGGSFNASGNLELHVPKLRHVGGDFKVEKTGLAHLPPNLEHIGGNAYISSTEPYTLLNELIEAKSNGILKGFIFVDNKVYKNAPPKPLDVFITTGSTPDITSGKIEGYFRSANFNAFFLRNIKPVVKVSPSVMTYTYTLAVMDTLSQSPKIFVTLEKSKYGTKALGLFVGDGVHFNLGYDPLWENIDNFINKALSISQERIGELLIESKIKKKNFLSRFF